MFCTNECWICEDKACEHYISKQDLYFENTQLKEEYQTELDENCKLSELWKNSQVENRHLKSVLKEIREYIENKTYSSACTMKTILHLENDELYDLLEIIDKGIKKED